MSTALVPAPPAPLSLPETMELAGTFVRSGFFQDTKDVAQAVVKIIAGRELGLGPFASVTGIHIIKGRPELSANVHAVMVRRCGYDYRVRRIDAEACVIEFFRGGESLGKSSFTIEDARRAGTQNTDRFPRNMLFARAMTNGVAWFCPDATSGVRVYAEGEVERDEAAEPVFVQPEVAEMPPRQQPAHSVARRLHDRDAEFAAAGISQPGDLVRHVTAAMNEAGHGADPDGWHSGELLAQVKTHVETFRGLMTAAARPEQVRQGAHAAQALCRNKAELDVLMANLQAEYGVEDLWFEEHISVWRKQTRCKKKIDELDTASCAALGAFLSDAARRQVAGAA